MFYIRQKILLLFITKLNILNKYNLDDFDCRKYIQKSMFLFLQEIEEDSIKNIYNFVPYKQGGYSFILKKDWYFLKDTILKNTETLINITKTVPHKIESLIDNYISKYSNIPLNNLVDKIYKNYPYYTKYTQNNLQENTKEVITNNTIQENTLFTIGYEGITIEEYINNLIKNNIELLIDVRCNPLSRKYGFSKSFLEKELNYWNIKYIHIKELGIESSLRLNLDSKNLQSYEVLFTNYEKDLTTNKTQYLDELYSYFNTYNNIAITCFEKDVCCCHRGKIADYLLKFKNIKVKNL